jgi:hypothetical protein
VYAMTKAINDFGWYDWRACEIIGTSFSFTENIGSGLD